MRRLSVRIPTVPYGNAYEQGPERIERALAAIFDSERDNAFTLEDLCERIWPDMYPDMQGAPVKKKHRSSVARAAHNLVRRRPEIQCFYGAGLGPAGVLPPRRGDVLRYGAG